MWAMIGCSIALIIWSAGLSYIVRKHRRSPPDTSTEVHDAVQAKSDSGPPIYE